MTRLWLIVCVLVVGCAADNPLFGLVPGDDTAGDDDVDNDGTGFVTSTTGDGTADGGEEESQDGTDDDDDDDDDDDADETKGSDDDDDDDQQTSGPANTSTSGTGTGTDTDVGPEEGTGEGTEEGGSTGDPPELNGCCLLQPTPGCADREIETCVCVLDAFCCSVEWDQLCVDSADADCNAQCEFPQGEGNCCMGNGSPGCNDLAVQSCVCEGDVACCAGNWTGACAVQAHYECKAGCEPIPTTFHDCCASGPPGCNEVDIQECVCAVDPFCCAQDWDALCVSEALSNCEAQCFQEPGDGSCCETHPSPGCTGGGGGPGIQICVCETMAECCLGMWTADCVDEAMKCGAEC